MRYVWILRKVSTKEILGVFTSAEKANDEKRKLPNQELNPVEVFSWPLEY